MKFRCWTSAEEAVGEIVKLEKPWSRGREIKPKECYETMNFPKSWISRDHDSCANMKFMWRTSLEFLAKSDSLRTIISKNHDSREAIFSRDNILMKQHFRGTKGLRDNNLAWWHSYGTTFSQDHILAKPHSHETTFSVDKILGKPKAREYHSRETSFSRNQRLALLQPRDTTRLWL